MSLFSGDANRTSTYSLLRLEHRTNSATPGRASSARRKSCPEKNAACSVMLAKQAHVRLHQLLQSRIFSQLLDQLLDLLRLALVREQSGVVGQHENGVSQADHRNGRALFGARIENDVARGIDVNEIGHAQLPAASGLR